MTQPAAAGHPSFNGQSQATAPAREPHSRRRLRLAVKRAGLLACLAVLLAPGVWAAEEQELIATLQSTAGVPQKCAACQQLRVVGTVQAVPALAALLGEERTAHAARYALEGMPCAEAGTALREAAGKSSGSIKAS